jgi:hypothetical protein
MPHACTNCRSEPHNRHLFFPGCLLNAQCLTFLRDGAQRCLANKFTDHSARLLHRDGTSVTSEVDVEQTVARSATWSPGPSSPLISATAICARSAPAAPSANSLAVWNPPSRTGWQLGLRRRDAHRWCSRTTARTASLAPIPYDQSAPDDAGAPRPHADASASRRKTR